MARQSCHYCIVTRSLSVRRSDDGIILHSCPTQLPSRNYNRDKAVQRRIVDRDWKYVVRCTRWLRSRQDQRPGGGNKGTAENRSITRWMIALPIYPSSHLKFTRSVAASIRAAPVYLSAKVWPERQPNWQSTLGGSEMRWNVSFCPFLLFCI